MNRKGREQDTVLRSRAEKTLLGKLSKEFRVLMISQWDRRHLGLDVVVVLNMIPMHLHLLWLKNLTGYGYSAKEFLCLS